MRMKKSFSLQVKSSFTDTEECKYAWKRQLNQKTNKQTKNSSKSNQVKNRIIATDYRRKRHGGIK